MTVRLSGNPREGLSLECGPLDWVFLNLIGRNKGRGIMGGFEMEAGVFVLRGNGNFTHRENTKSLPRLDCDKIFFDF